MNSEGAILIEHDLQLKPADRCRKCGSKINVMSLKVEDVNLTICDKCFEDLIKFIDEELEKSKLPET